MALAEQVSALRARLAALNPGASIVRATDATASTLLGHGLFDAGGKISDVARWLAAEAHVSGRHGHLGHAHAHDVIRHDSSIQAFCVTFDTPLHWQGIGTGLEMLIATRGESLLRVKGLLNIAGQNRPVVIHGVQHLFHEPMLLRAWPEGDPRTSRIVFITRDLDRDVIERSLRAFESAAAN
jgi:G3E family GTPase